ncbi:hypothetical protein GCM10007979_11960 [Nocardioides albus]|nr:hypothetical protein GCM10007979_11960 [Nocardioides albus]
MDALPKGRVLLLGGGAGLSAVVLETLEIAADAEAAADPGHHDDTDRWIVDCPFDAFDEPVKKFIVHCVEAFRAVEANRRDASGVPLEQHGR